MNESLQRAAHEQALSTGDPDYLGHLRQIGEPSPFACPDCHGGLWRIRGAAPERFRCHTGHSFTARTLDRAVAADSDRALWNALRALHERASVLSELAQVNREAQRVDEAQKLEQASARAAQQAVALRAMINRQQEPPDAA